MTQKNDYSFTPEKNPIIRKAQHRFFLKQWQVAEILGIHPDTLSRKLRHELPKEEQKRIAGLIEEAMKK